ncbi:hypothetical protein CR513_44719, partial [Mucuna pruriens]
MKVAQSRQRCYHDKTRKDLEFKEGDHVFLKVIPWTRVSKALKSHKFSSSFIGPYQILKRVGEVSNQTALPPILVNLYDVFQVSELQKYSFNPSVVLRNQRIEERKCKGKFKAETSPNVIPFVVVGEYDSRRVNESLGSSTSSLAKQIVRFIKQECQNLRLDLDIMSLHYENEHEDLDM